MVLCYTIKVVLQLEGEGECVVLSSGLSADAFNGPNCAVPLSLEEMAQSLSPVRPAGTHALAPSAPYQQD